MKYVETKLHTLETENSALRDTVGSLEEQMTTLGHEKEELRSMNERSSAELRKALEVGQSAVIVLVSLPDPPS